MPTFFFNVYDDLAATDEDGLELPDLDAAKAEAVRGARALACEQVTRGRLNLSHRIEVTDEIGRTVATVTFRDAVTVEA